MRAGHGFVLNYSVVLRKQINVVLPSHRQFSAMIIPCFFPHVGSQNRAPGHLSSLKSALQVFFAGVNVLSSVFTAAAKHNFYSGFKLSR